MFLINTLQEVIHYEKDTFVEDSQDKPLMIKFYADYCGHCKHLAPIYLNLSDNVSDIKFGEIECPSHKLICGKYKIKGFPTLILFKDNLTYEYEGPRNEINMKNWLELFDKPLFLQDNEQNLTEISQKYSYDHYYELQLNDCNKYEENLALLKGQALITCNNVLERQNNSVKVTFFNQNITYTQEQEEYTAQDIIRIIYYYNTELFTRISVQHFQQCIRLGGIIFTYTKNTKYTGEIQALLKQQAKQQNIKTHYGMLFKEGQYSERIIKNQLQLNLTQDQIIYFKTNEKPFQLYSIPLDVEGNITEQYYNFINNLENYQKPYNPVQRQPKAKSNIDIRAVIMMITLSVIVIMITTICICDYYDKKDYERQKQLLEKSIQEAEKRKQIEYNKLIQCQEEQNEEEQNDLVSLKQIEEEIKNE